LFKQLNGVKRELFKQTILFLKNVFILLYFFGTCGT